MGPLQWDTDKKLTSKETQLWMLMVTQSILKLNMMHMVMKSSAQVILMPLVTESTAMLMLMVNQSTATLMPLVTQSTLHTLTNSTDITPNQLQELLTSDTSINGFGELKKSVLSARINHLR